MGVITILGAGAMGSAFTVPCTDRGHEVRLVGTHLDGELIAAVREGLPHPRIDVSISRKNLAVAEPSRFREMVEDADLLVVGVSSPGIPWIIKTLAETLVAPIPILLLTKGLHVDGERIVVFPDYLRRHLSHLTGLGFQVMAIGGPSIARELAERRDTSIVLAGSDPDQCMSAAAMISTDYYHVRPESDHIGVEVAAAFKNLYAIAVGICEGSAELRAKRVGGSIGFDPAAAVFAQSIAEIAYLSDIVGGKAETVYGLAGVGDLYVTSRRGRNNRAGKMLAGGMPWVELRHTAMRNDTIEGAELAAAIAPTITNLLSRGVLEEHLIPLLRTVIATVVHGKTPEIPWSEFFV